LLWTRGVAARETLSYLDRRGIDAEPALIGAGISRRQLSQDDIGLSVASQYRFLELAAAEANDQLLGLRVAAELVYVTLRWRGLDSNLYGAFPVKWFFSVYHQFFVRSGKRVLRPVACDQVPGARGRGQGTETLAKLGGLPPSGACVSQRPLFKPGAGFDA